MARLKRLFSPAAQNVAMTDFPVRSLVIGYGVAACLGAVIAAVGAGPVWVGGVVWLGGAAATLGVAALSVRERRPTARLEPEDRSRNLVLAEELRRWEEDRLAEREGATAEQRRRA